MKIGSFKTDTSGANTRFSASLSWEESQRAPLELFFEIPSEFASDLTVSANSFLVGAIFPAMVAGEKRIAIEGQICPRLRTGLLTILDQFQHWYGRERQPIAIEAKTWQEARGRRTPTRAGSFFTGGIDSLATIRRNRLLFPRNHRESIQDAILLYGINFDSDDSPATFSRAIEELSEVAKDAEISLVPVYTNLRRDLNPDGRFFTYQFHGALLGATAHALSGRLTTMSIASSHDIPNLIPWGSHPLIDPNFSSFDMRIYHDSLELSRFAKAKLIADWEAALRNIKVCTFNWPGINCGKCEKCIRTMLALLALGVLERSRAFTANDISEQDVRSIELTLENQPHYYRELVEPLRMVNRLDLARGIEHILSKYWNETGLFGPLKRIDRTYFGDSFRLLKKSLRESLSRNPANNGNSGSAIRVVQNEN